MAVHVQCMNEYHLSASLQMCKAHSRTAHVLLWQCVETPVCKATDITVFMMVVASVFSSCP